MSKSRDSSQKDKDELFDDGNKLQTDTTDVPQLESLSPQHEVEDESQYLTGVRLWVALVGMMMAELVTGLGGNMISPAFNTIVNVFDAASKLGWVSAAFYMTQFPCMLLAGQVFSVFDGKWILMLSVFTFAIGSTICGAAQNVETVAVGRAVSGIGASGIWVGVLALVAVVAPLKNRPRILGIFGLVNALSAGVGPVLAGYFADSVTWRLCFLFTLPVAFVSLCTIFFAIPNHSSAYLDEDVQAIVLRRCDRIYARNAKPDSFIFKLVSIDWIGFMLAMAAIVCLQVALQWGGTTYPWVSSQVLGLIIGGFGGLMGALIVWSFYMKETALLPTRLFRNRTQWACCLLSLVTLYANLIGVIILPYFFEVVLGTTALQAGYDILPYLLLTIFWSLVAGLLTTHFGYYWHWLIIGGCMSVITGALFGTVTEHASYATYYGYQILFSLAIGLTQQQIYVAIQADSKQVDVHRRIAVVSFTQLFGGTIGPTVSIAILNNLLIANLAKYAPEAPPSVMRNTSIIKTLPASLQAAVVHAYMLSLNKVFFQLCAIGGVTLFTSLFVRNINVKKGAKVSN